MADITPVETTNRAELVLRLLTLADQTQHAEVRAAALAEVKAAQVYVAPPVSPYKDTSGQRYDLTSWPFRRGFYAQTLSPMPGSGYGL